MWSSTGSTRRPRRTWRTPPCPPEGRPATTAWEEARALCDEAFHPLIDALIAAETPEPDHFGEDLVAAGRVVGAMEFGWSKPRVAVAETSFEGVGWALIRFDPETNQVGETVSRIITALQEART
jgi:DEAD/DEAH box helicase domain-containing protein